MQTGRRTCGFEWKRSGVSNRKVTDEYVKIEYCSL